MPPPKYNLFSFRHLQFEFTAVQLNSLSWREFVNRPNPVACALMAKMRMTPEDRPKVRLECLRLLATLRLDPARSRLIGGFVENYLRLTAEEMRAYEREFAALPPEDKETTMELITSWELRGIEQGISQGVNAGMERMAMRQLNRRLGSVPANLEARLKGLTTDQLDELGEALLDFTTPDDLERWLTQH